ncbi:MAG: hypothetical protein KBT06_01480 [Prevotellaceae bacterium]|nr:hypothetical protein [Candidatus Colivivens equi]
MVTLIARVLITKRKSAYHKTQECLSQNVRVLITKHGSEYHIDIDMVKRCI